MKSTRPILALLLTVTFALLAGEAGAQSVTRPTFLALQEAQVMMDEARYAEARQTLEDLVIQTEGNPYDYALANQYLAHTSVLMEDPDRARIALAAALEMLEIPDDLRANMSLFYGTVLLGEEEFEAGRDAMEAWFRLAEVKAPSQIFSLSYANYMTGNLPRAEELVARAIGESEQPQESWYQLYYQVLFDLRKFSDAEFVALGMISRNPGEKNYWRMLASHYLQREDSARGLATIMTAYFNSLIDDQSDLNQVVSLYGHLEAPEKAARLLKQWLADGRIETNAESLKQLGNLWLLAREREPAIQTLQDAARLGADGQVYEMLGGVYFEDESWESAYDAYVDAIRVGGVEDPSRTALLAGISAFRAERQDDARTMLEEAAKSDDYRGQAEQLLRQLD